MGRNLADVLAAAPPEPKMGAEVDVTEWLGPGPEGEPTVFRYRELTVPQMATYGTLAKNIRAAHPDWPTEFCQSVAMVSLAHAEPAPPFDRKTVEFYMDMAEARPKLWMALWTGLARAFGWAGDLEEAIQSEKKGSKEPSTAS
jgi:hypothetical protein